MQTNDGYGLLVYMLQTLPTFIFYNTITNSLLLRN